MPCGGKHGKCMQRLSALPKLLLELVHGQRWQHVVDKVEEPLEGPMQLELVQRLLDEVKEWRMNWDVVCRRSSQNCIASPECKGKPWHDQIKHCLAICYRDDYKSWWDKCWRGTTLNCAGCPECPNPRR
mmetsp:Transcript_34106/g.94321  ORF Transcript_34106/g.94321 Transcript_34106/m.94321 type:complete len:129 (-) Transcript_34106:119-505(-)